MPPERFPPDDPLEWLNRARSNLARAKAVIPGVYLEDLCFDAQQAAEKAVKAVLIRRQVTFPYIHDLARLITLLEQVGEAVPDAVKASADLTKFATVARYPGFAEPVSREDYEQAVRIAEDAVRWAGETIQRPKPT